MKIKNFFLILFALCMMLGKISAQSDNNSSYHNCALDEIILRHARQTPGIVDKYITYENEQKRILLLLTENPSSIKNTKATDTLIDGKRVIPVVFHIIHKYGVENITREQVEDAIALMNLDYNKKNADTANTFPLFKPRAADAQIEFRLARIDPVGKCTDGINRVYDPRTDYAYFNVMRDNSWPYSKYMNVYAVSYIYPEGMVLPSGALIGGLSPLTPDNALSPSAGDTLLDGVLVRHDCVGSIGTATSMAGSGINNHNRVMTHETGHFFDLYHTFQNIMATLLGLDNCMHNFLMNGDEIDDTPPVLAATQGCPAAGSVNSCSTSISGYGDEPDMIENYMDYANGVCQNAFTLGQLDRINTTMMGTRRSLWSYENLVATGVLDTLPSSCAPMADFISNRVLVCEGVQVSFTDFSYNGTATSWEWTFDGGTPATSTDQNPVVTYATAGIYDVSLKAVNANGDNTITKTELIHVGNSSNNTAAPFNEGFEQANVFDSFYTENSTPNESKWVRTTQASYSGNASVKLNNNQTYILSTDALITPAYDLTNIDNPRLSFRMAFKGTIMSDPLGGAALNNYGDLRILVSSNCGQTWLPRKSIIDSALTTAGLGDTNAFVPTSADWREETVTALNSVAGNANVMFKFEFKNKGGNNLYIDDINIFNYNVGIEDEIIDFSEVNIYPNPINENSVISFTLESKNELNIKLMDVLGKEIETIYQGTLPAGDHKIDLNKKSLVAGIYFIQLNFNKNTVVKPIIVY